MTTTSAPAERRTALTYPRALDAAHRSATGGDGLVPSPTSHVIASTVAIPDAPDGPLTRFGIAVRDAGPEPPTDPATANRFAAELLNLHAGLLHRALKHAIDHLGGRTSDGTTLLSRQLVQGQLADIAMRLREDRGMPPERRSADRVARWRTHKRLVATGRDLLRLLGASGFLADGPAGELHLAEITGNVYLHPATEHTDA